jgi:ubiquinone/menaquinone biosynthesis C-methylase UbiE
MLVDVGAGDGRFVLDAARRDPSRLFVAIDPVAESMAASANRARREHLDNALFVVAAVESLPCELVGVADRITVLFPWGSLLAGVAKPVPNVLAALARIARPDATLEVLINRSAEPDDITDLADRYRRSGFEVDRLERLSEPPYATTWGKRVTHRSEVLRLTARIGA